MTTLMSMEEAALAYRVTVEEVEKLPPGEPATEALLRLTELVAFLFRRIGEPVYFATREMDDEILRLVVDCNIITAIKRFRVLHNFGLKEAKDAVEALIKSAVDSGTLERDPTSRTGGYRYVQKAEAYR